MPSFALLPRCPFSPRRLPPVFFTTCLVLASSPPTPPASDSCSPSPRLHRHIHRHNRHSATSAYVIQQETDYISRLSRLHKHNASKILSSPTKYAAVHGTSPPRSFFRIFAFCSLFFLLSPLRPCDNQRRTERKKQERERPVR